MTTVQLDATDAQIVAVTRAATMAVEGDRLIIDRFDGEVIDSRQLDGDEVVIADSPVGGLRAWTTTGSARPEVVSEVGLDNRWVIIPVVDLSSLVMRSSTGTIMSAVRCDGGRWIVTLTRDDERHPLDTAYGRAVAAAGEVDVFWSSEDERLVEVRRAVVGGLRQRFGAIDPSMVRVTPVTDPIIGGVIAAAVQVVVALPVCGKCGLDPAMPPVWRVVARRASRVEAPWEFIPLDGDATDTWCGCGAVVSEQIRRLVLVDRMADDIDDVVDAVDEFSAVVMEDPQQDVTGTTKALVVSGA